jgi:hypothetical protein
MCHCVWLYTTVRVQPALCGLPRLFPFTPLLDGLVNKLLPVLVGLALSSSAWAEPLDRPDVKVGDTWVYRSTTERGPSGWNQTEEELNVTRVTKSALFIATKPTGSTQAPKEMFVGPDWSRIRDVNGKETVVNRPLAFPLSDGKSWDVTYTEQNPNKNHKLEKFDSRFTVVGYEAVEVPAGKFRALKIESDGHWEAQIAPGQSIVQGAQTGQGGATIVSQVQNNAERQATGRLYKAFWYVPEVKRWVKSVEEYYSNGGVRSERYTQELVSFKPGDSNARSGDSSAQ